MKFPAISILLFLLVAPTLADDIRFAPGVTVAASVTLIADSNGILQIDRSNPIVIGGSTPAVPEDPTAPNPQQGLTEFSKAAVLSQVPSYRNRSRDSVRIGFAYETVVDLIDDGKADTQQKANDALQAAIDGVLRFSSVKAEWQPWRDAINAQLNSMSIQNLAGLRKAYSEIQLGLTQDQLIEFSATAASEGIESPSPQDILAADTSGEAWGDGAFLKFFMEFILPILLKLILV